MLLTSLREKFKFYSDPGITDHCLNEFGLTFITLTRILQGSELFDDISDKDRADLFNLKNWKREKTQLYNDKIGIKITIPDQYL